MRPRAFEYVRAAGLSDVFRMLKEHGGDAVILAGGQSIVPVLNMRLAEATVLIDINRIPDLDRIEISAGLIRVGAMCRHEEVRRSPVIAAHAPLVAKALRHVAHPAIRNRGTFGGSICNADPASELPACMLALGGTMQIENAAGKRHIAAADFFLGLYETCIEEADVLTSVSFPALKNDEMQFFDEITRRRGDYALAGLAAVARRDGDRLRDVSLAFLSCGDRALPAPELCALIEDAEDMAIDDRLIDAALRNDLDPPSDPVTSSGTRLHLAGVLARRAIAYFQAGGNACPDGS